VHLSVLCAFLLVVAVLGFVAVLLVLSTTGLRRLRAPVPVAATAWTAVAVWETRRSGS
jgi:hypothetical protein